MSPKATHGNEQWTSTMTSIPLNYSIAIHPIPCQTTPKSTQLAFEEALRCTVAAWIWPEGSESWWYGPSTTSKYHHDMVRLFSDAFGGGRCPTSNSRPDCTSHQHHMPLWSTFATRQQWVTINSAHWCTNKSFVPSSFSMVSRRKSCVYLNRNCSDTKNLIKSQWNLLANRKTIRLLLRKPRCTKYNWYSDMK